MEKAKLASLEKARLTRLLRHERRLQKEGYCRIAGVDEAGRGPLAGPVVAAACILPLKVRFLHLNDSKKLDSQTRERLFDEIVSCPGVLYGLGVCDAETIDRINILQATLSAMRKALESLEENPDYILVDGNKLPIVVAPAEALIGGDAKSASIAAASILAKVTRDRMMKEAHELWPQYGFHKHKGYGTQEHLQALEKWGICPLHRRSFDPIKKKTALQQLELC